jgi:polysaccharide export outer membrane protein
MKRFMIAMLGVIGAVLLAGCADNGPKPINASEVASTEYLIGPGDSLNVFVWRNPELSVTVPVRPDGRISTPLVEDMQAVGKTPTQLARDMETALGQYIKSPQVNIIVQQFVGTFGEQIRVVGKAAKPQALAYRRHMTLLDVMIEVGGLAPGASGNRSKIIRRYGGQESEIHVRLEDLLNNGRMSENVEMLPGDVVFIPESLL